MVEDASTPCSESFQAKSAPYAWIIAALGWIVIYGYAEEYVGLEAGRAYRFRYLLDGHRWDNDWAADAYEPNDFGAGDSVVDLTALPAAAPRATPEAPTARNPTMRSTCAHTKTRSACPWLGNAFASSAESGPT